MTGGSAARLSRTPAPEPERFTTGAILAQRYRIAGRVGRGGMGEVYRAYDLILEQDVALKFLPKGLASSPGALDRFRNEVRLARQVSHPNVCRVYDIGEIEDAPFLTMEYVDGEDLASLLRRIGRLPSDKALDISRRLCAGLAAAHEKGVLHRDLKPANIMIDGRGEVLITDFGLAAVAGTVDEAAAGQGTPAYQAPEQLAGRDVTVRSDLYALGLVFYEIFTGRRAFEAQSVEELARMQRESTPASVTSFAKDVDPAVERAILRCLAPDPRQRPASARAVAVSLPGADPLAAAIAAGETPSPEMVAQAGENEGLRTPVAVGLLAWIVAGLVVLAALGGSTRFPEKTPFENSPEALAAMARDIGRRLGYAQRPADTAFGIEASSEYLGYAQQHYRIDRFWAQAAAARPAPLTFWYRQGPQPMNPREYNWVTFGTPGFSVPGMLRLRLDMEGRLLAFEARPAGREPSASRPPDWKPLFDAARLDPAKLQPAAPEWTPEMALDASVAWTGAWPESPEVPIRVEAAAWRGKPVSFRIIEPWIRPASNAPTNPFLSFNLFWIVVPYFVLFPAGIFLARRNVRLKRGDLHGAIRLALAAFALDLGADLLAMHYFWSPDMAWRIFVIASYDLAQSVFLGVAYLAIEPYVRRRCPRILISWSRLLQSGARDPLVASHVLAGVAAGVLFALLFSLAERVRMALGQIDRLVYVSTAIYSARHYLGTMLGTAWAAAFRCMVVVFLFFLMRLLLRRDWIAAGGVVLVFVGMNSGASSVPALDAPVAFVEIGILMAVMLRFGLPGMLAMMVVIEWGSALVPLTLDPSRWFFGYGITELLVVVGLAVWAFRTALGGRPLLRDETLS
jgi:serine/threonine-protein kinase